MTEIRSSLRASLASCLRGLWLPLVTPFRDGELDEASLRRLVRHYAAMPVNGLILAATTGESLTLTRQETGRLVFAVRDEMMRAGPARAICLGLSGSNTGALLDTLDETAPWPIDGYLISCPHYSRPSQHGMQLHFTALAERAAHPVMLYNIPSCAAASRASPCSPARTLDITRRWSMAPTAASLHPRISIPKPSQRSLACRRRASTTPRARAGGRWRISPDCCFPSRARRRSNTGCGVSG